MISPTDFLWDADFCSRLGLVLLHSLWQVAVLAIVAWGVERLLLGRSVERSYSIHVAALLLSLAAMPVTYALIGRVVEPETPHVAQLAPQVDSPNSSTESALPVPTENSELKVAPVAVASAPAFPRIKIASGRKHLAFDAGLVVLDTGRT